MTVSSVSFQHIIDRMNRISALNVKNSNTAGRSTALAKSTSAKKSASVGKTVGAGTGSTSIQKTGTTGSTTVSSLQKTGAGFRKIAEKLQNTDWGREYRLSGKKNLQNSVRTFAEEYNRLLAGVKNVSDGEGSTYGSKFTQLLQDNKEALSEIGLKIGTDGTLSVDSRALKKAKADAFETVFKGADSVAGKVAVGSIYAEAQNMLSNMGKLYQYGSVYGSGLGAYGLGNLGTYSQGALGAYGLGSMGLVNMALGNYGMQTGALYGLGGYGYGAYGYGTSGLNSLYAALSSYAGRYIDTQL